MTTPAKTTWRDAWQVYKDRRVISILFLGFSSGLPLALTFSTLSIWLAESSIDKTTIGLFALAGLPYTIKFAWAPIIDRLPLPGITKLFGRRRGWMLTTQIALMTCITALGMTDPVRDTTTVALIALLVAFCSASQDIVIDAYRVEILERDQLGAGAAMIVLGYRIGMLVSGAGALYLANFFGWEAAYLLMAACVLVGIVTVLVVREPEPNTSVLSSKKASLVGWIVESVVDPFADFLRRPAWWLILLFIVLYKFGDALAGVMSNPFYVELGFTKLDIANISKLFGIFATICGVLVGGVFVKRYGILRSLVICGVLQMVSNLMFVLLAWVGHDLFMLTLTIGLENLAGGMGTAAFVAYLSSLCHISFTATQYALLSSFSAFARTLLSSSGGWLADQMSWASFFIVSTIAAVPGLLLLWWLGKLVTGESRAENPE
jgi:PAT family beta-lactamase induction signal transducer AmpG